MDDRDNIIEPAPAPLHVAGVNKGAGRADLLEAAQRKPVRRFFQFDVIDGMPPNESGWGAVGGATDNDGQLVYGGWTHELRNLNELRVLVPEGADAEAMIRGLRKVIDWLEDGSEVIRYDPAEYERNPF